jgi:glycosyltransferase involved in cell wall biosynthesis
MQLTSLSIVLPCFDEEENVAGAIWEATEAAKLVAQAHEIIVVDDGSTDGTLDAALEQAGCDPRVRVVVHEHNRGYGAALWSGIALAHMDWVFLTDGDLQFDLTDLRLFLPLAPEHDLLKGYRLDRQDPIHRRIKAAAWNWLVRRVLGVRVGDVDCAFKLVRSELLEQIELTSEGAMVSPELILKAQRLGARIAELGVHHRPRRAGRSSGANPRVIARAFREMRAVHTAIDLAPAPVPVRAAAVHSRVLRA